MRTISVPLAVLTTVVATVRTSTAGTVDAEEVLDFRWQVVVRRLIVRTVVLL